MTHNLPRYLSNPNPSQIHIEVLETSEHDVPMKIRVDVDYDNYDIFPRVWKDNVYVVGICQDQFDILKWNNWKLLSYADNGTYASITFELATRQQNDWLIAMQLEMYHNLRHPDGTARKGHVPSPVDAMRDMQRSFTVIGGQEKGYCIPVSLSKRLLG